MSSISFCSLCGAANEPARQHCFACGHPLTNENEQEQDAILLHERYLLGELLGSGGFSRVYRGSDQHANGRAVAIKEISLRGLSVQQAIEATETFHREMRILSALTHPQVPRVYDHFTDQSHWYLILEYIEGQTLETFLSTREAQGQPLSLEEIINMGLQLCMVLEYLHSRQPPIIYRDLKPSNIMHTPRSLLVLIDFGIARAYRHGQARDTQRLGSPGYAAPEQYGRAQTTPQSDIYSLGALLHFLLSGQDPAEELPPPRSLAPRPLQHESERAELATLSQRMRSPDPAMRPQSCQEVAFSLQAIKQRLMLHESTRIWRPPTPQPLPLHHTPLAGQQQTQQFAPPGHSPLPRTTSHISRRTLLISFAALTAVAAIGVSWHNEHTAPKVVDIGSPDEKPELALQLLVCPGNAGNFPEFMHTVAWAPDGKLLASASADGTLEVWRNDSANTVWTVRAHKMRIWAVAWSPNGKFLASASDDGTVRIGDTTKLLTYQMPIIYPQFQASVRAVAWSPSGHLLASASSDGVVNTWDSSTGHTLLTYQGHTAGYAVTSVAWSPDGNHLASASQDHTVQLWTASAGNRFQMYQGHTDFVNSVIWSPDGTRLASASSDGTAQVWDASTGHTILTYKEHTNVVNAIAWSPDGKFLASASDDQTVRVWEVATGRTTLICQGHTAPVNAVSWSPDGKLLASASNDGTARIWQIS